MPEQLELQLPYEEITSVANRDYMRDKFKPGAKVSYVMPFKKILIREGFNQRTVYEGIDELAASIDKHGQQEPFVVDVLPDGRVYLERGHRRYKAYQLLIEQGKFKATSEVEFFPNRIKDNITEERRMVNQYVTNNLQKPLKPLEQAGVAYSLKHNFGQEKTNEEVAALMTVSRQTIDNLIIIAEADDSVKESIRNGDMSMTNALSFIRGQRKAQRQADKKEEESHKNTAAATSLPVDINAKELAELHELEQTVIEDDGQLEEVEDGDEEIRISNYNPDVPHETRPLDLVGNSIASTGKEEKKPDDGTVKFDETRIEIAQVQNCIGLADRIEARFNKVECIDDGTKKDISDWVKWLQKDLAEIRQWIHSNKKQNKIR